MKQENNNKIEKIHSEAKIHDDSFIDASCIIGRGVIIEKNVYISQGAIIYGEAVIKKGTYIGERCIIGHPQRDKLQRIIKSKTIKIESKGALVTIGENNTIRSGTIIYSDVYMESGCQTGHNVLIRENTKIGENTLIGTNSVIDGNVIIGKNVSIQTGVYIPLYSKIGDFVFMGPYSKLTNDKYMMRKKYPLKGPIIESYVSIGANAVILPNITLRERTIVGASSVVTKNTQKADILIGNPAKVLKKVPDDWN
ncbi:MAG: N-acetyltransferase [Promethearchaeota archaeon]|nr:MAG: N-acetyltransferase [Candidatus Lokiarchaeota archaeon]